MDRKSDGIIESTDREPRESDADAFAKLFRDAYRKCFASAFTAPLTETESHRLSVEIAESTGLEIGWKSLKNYSSYLLGRSGRVENPSVATLDTLARYVAGAPLTDETPDATRPTALPTSIDRSTSPPRAARRTLIAVGTVALAALLAVVFIVV